jgi:hypothetical protein
VVISNRPRAGTVTFGPGWSDLFAYGAWLLLNKIMPRAASLGSYRGQHLITLHSNAKRRSVGVSCRCWRPFDRECVCVFVCAMIIYSQFYVCCYIVRESHSAGAELIKGVEFSKPIFLNGKFTTEAI